MTEGCKHGPTDLVPQPCVDCERERLSSEGATHRFAERLSELAPVGGADDKNAPASALPDVPTVGDLDTTPLRFKADAFDIGDPQYPKTLTPYTVRDRIAQWREQSQLSQRDAEMARRVDDGAQAMYLDGRAFAFERCADELESTLRVAAATPTETLVACECCQLKVPERLASFGIGVRGGQAAWCAACRLYGPDWAARRDEVRAMRKARLSAPAI